jgi:hypothetical protein
VDGQPREVDAAIGRVPVDDLAREVVVGGAQAVAVVVRVDTVVAVVTARAE